MSKVSTWMLGGAVLSLALAGCDDGPVGKAINCGNICDHFNECLPDVDESECRSECKDDVDRNDVETCAECLEDKDSCKDCSVDCAGVGIDMLFSS